MKAPVYALIGDQWDWETGFSLNLPVGTPLATPDVADIVGPPIWEMISQ